MLSQIPFTDLGGGLVPQKKVAQNDVKHIIVLEFLRFNDFLGVMGRGGGGGGSMKKFNRQPTNRTYGHYDD